MPVLKRVQQHKLLLDTHVWIWYVIGNPILTKGFRLDLEQAFLNHAVLVSPMSIWEIGMLVDKKRIEISQDVMEWVTQALDVPGLQLCPFTPKIAIQSTKLPETIHGDPVDRILIATAIEARATLVTCDQKILKYGAGKAISVYDPTA